MSNIPHLAMLGLAAALSSPNHGELGIRGFLRDIGSLGGSGFLSAAAELF
jgi:hypothetical protein